MCNISYPTFSCRISVKNVSDKDKALQCELCELWVHIKCNNLDYLDYRYLQNSNESCYCIGCCSTNFLACCTNTDKNSTYWIDLENGRNSSLSLKRSSNLELLVNQFNNATRENSNNPKKFYRNIMTLRKCITLKYLTKINRYPCFM